MIQGGEQRRFAMPIPLRSDFDADRVRAGAKRSKDGPQARRLLALAAIYDGAMTDLPVRIEFNREPQTQEPDVSSQAGALP
jgi:hypothetical protein